MALAVDIVVGNDLDHTDEIVQSLEADGWDGLWTNESGHDPLMQAVAVARATSRATVATAVAIAFARTPMVVAHAGHDLQRYSHGRFVLGLGSQVKAHIERRYGMPWSHPAARMREYVLALRAIWSSWQDGTRLSFEGDFYSHTLMPPFFAPPAHEWGAPPVVVAAVGERMTEVAGEVADGIFLHPFGTERFMREVTVPALERGRARRADGDAPVARWKPAFAAIGRTEEELARAVAGTRTQIAFYASTPAYLPVLELHGWSDLHTEVAGLIRQGRWDDLGAAVDDEVLDALAAVGTPEEVGRALRERWGPLVDRLSMSTPYEIDPAAKLAAARALRAG